MALAHLLLFFLSMVAFWYSNSDPIISMFFFEFIALYVAITHRSRREILPPLAILIIFKIVTLPITISLFSSETLEIYLGTVISLNLVLAYLLSRFYRVQHLRKLFKVETPRRLIPQVLAMVSVLLIGAIHNLIVLFEVVLWGYDQTIFSSTPFFYSHYEPVKIVIKGLLLLAIWSMCLDSYFVDYSKYEKKNPKKSTQI